MLACKCECVCVWVSVGACVWVSKCVRACSCVRVHTCSACVDLIVVVAGIMACSWLPSDRASLCCYSPLQLLFPLSPFPSPSLLFCFAFIPSLSLAVVPAKASKKYVTSSGQEPSISCHLPRLPPLVPACCPRPPWGIICYAVGFCLLLFICKFAFSVLFAYAQFFIIYCVFKQITYTPHVLLFFGHFGHVAHLCLAAKITADDGRKLKQVRKWYTRQRDRKREGKEAIKAIKIVEQLRRIEAHKSRKRSWESWRR